MSAEEHRHAAEGIVATVQIVVVSTTRTTDTDQSGLLLTELFEAAGHRVAARHVIKDDVRAIRRKLGELATDGESQVVVLTGGTGVSRLDVTADAVTPMFDTPIPGFGELFRWLSYEQVGSAAMLSRAAAGMMGPLVVFALPGSARACQLATEKLILPELAHLLREVQKEAVPEPPVDFDDEMDELDDLDEEEEDTMPEESEKTDLPPPSGKLGAPGGGHLGVLSEEVTNAAPVEAQNEDARPIPPAGWRRAVYEIEGTLIRDTREELPWELESLSPVVDVLHTAGEAAVLKLPSGIKYGIYGWPDLRRDNSKVIAIGWGQPIAEILALHRYPSLTGTAIEEDRGLLPGRNADLRALCEQVTGSAPKDTSGELFALQADAVWIQRGNRVIKWDGRKEFNDGTPKQVIATLMLHWSNR